MFFRLTLDEFSKAAQAKKTQIEKLRIISENNHKSALDKLCNAFSDFASQIYPYFEETCKVSGKSDLYFIIHENDWHYEVTFYSNNRIEITLSYQCERYIILEYQVIHGQENSVKIAEKLSTGDADINRFATHFQSSAFISSITDKLLECIS
ncbi:MAG: hypothetical protein IKK93_03215 [Campylobacter sp.]|nr:hypothetical protein [Campylobacter sp.]